MKHPGPNNTTLSALHKCVGIKERSRDREDNGECTSITNRVSRVGPSTHLQ